MKPIISCGLPLSIQRLYIKRLKHMIMRWQDENFCGHCPISQRFKTHTDFVIMTQFDGHWYWNNDVCAFCRENVGVKHSCPCGLLGPKKALKRAKDFIERFETQEDGGKKC